MFENLLAFTKNGMERWKQSTLVRMVLFLFLAALFYFSMSDRLVPKTYDIQLGHISEKTIIATREGVDTVATRKAQEQAAQEVQPVYTIITMKNDAVLDLIFDKLSDINADDQVTHDQKTSIYRRIIPAISEDFYADWIKNLKESGQYHSELLEEVEKQVKEQQYRIPEEVYFKFPLLTEENLAEMEPVAKEIVNKLMTEQITDAQVARVKVAELVNASRLSQKLTRELVQELVRFAITPNKFFDLAATEQARKEAVENTEPVMIKKGDVIVQKGQIITKEIYQRLDDLDMLKDKVSYWPQLGLSIFSLLMAMVLWMVIRENAKPIHHNNAHLFMFVLICLLNVIGMKIVALGQNLEYSHLGYLAPIAMGSMLIAVLIDTFLAYVSAIFFAILSSVIFNLDAETIFDFRFGFVHLIGSFTVIYVLHRANQRSSILKAGIMGSLFSVLALAALLILQHENPENPDIWEFLLPVAFALAGGILSSVLVIGLIPFFEATFGILSPLKLVELSNPNHPLLRKLLTETPGTYHHSVMVGNLSEAAAEAIGANGLLCRVGSFYHDVGKTKRPQYFIENQMNMENPHDYIDPYLSASIIIAHARDGVEMLKAHRIPKPICDIAEQHHGTTLLKYFYHKALGQVPEEEKGNVRESDFRYPGPKAQTKEAAIIGIADSVEAAVRSLSHPTVEQLETMIRKIIKDRLDDGQFSDCDLTLKELEIIAQSLKETLLGVFHSRIEYPEDQPPGDEASPGEGKG